MTRLGALAGELASVRTLAGAPRPAGLGCSTVAHRFLGFCAGCTGHPRLENAGWQLLALRTEEQETGP